MSGAPKSGDFAKKIQEAFLNYQSFKALKPKPKEAMAAEEEEKKKKKEEEEKGY